MKESERVSTPLAILDDAYRDAAEAQAEWLIEDSRKRDLRRQGGQAGIPEGKRQHEIRVGCYGENAVRRLLHYPPCRIELYRTHDVGPFDVKTRTHQSYGILASDYRIDKAIEYRVKFLLVIELTYGKTYAVVGWALPQTVRDKGVWKEFRSGGGAWLLDRSDTIDLDVDEYTWRP